MNDKIKSSIKAALKTSLKKWMALRPNYNRAIEILNKKQIGKIITIERNRMTGRETFITAITTNPMLGTMTSYRVELSCEFEAYAEGRIVRFRAGTQAAVLVNVSEVFKKGTKSATIDKWVLDQLDIFYAELGRIGLY